LSDSVHRSAISKIESTYLARARVRVRVRVGVGVRVRWAISKVESTYRWKVMRSPPRRSLCQSSRQACSISARVMSGASTCAMRRCT